MKKLFSYMFLIILCIGAVSAALAAGFVSDGDQIEKATKSVLKLYVYDSLSAAEDKYIATGSGFVAFNSSTLITNYHVIDGAAMVRASDDDGRIYVLDKVFCADKNADIAILGFKSPTSLAPLDLFADDQLKRGSPVVAIGSPKGLKNTVSTGVISYQYDEEGVPMIQMTAPISPGSSGGALFNDDGKVIGVTSASYKSEDEYGEDTGAQNLNFAVNIAAAKAMYKAWDGQEHTFGNFSSSAKMDYTGAYDNSGDNQAAALVETWTCLNCGHENTSKFCKECGAEKPFWVCACGSVNSSNQFCGDCGKSYTELIDKFNSAVQAATQHDYIGAIAAMEALGAFDSGSFDTVEGQHAVAKKIVEKIHYDQGIYLVSIGGNHDEIIATFVQAGEYKDAKDQISAENERYLKSWYDTGVVQLNNGEYEAAIDSFTKAESYSDAATMILEAYYQQGKHFLDEGMLAESIVAFEKAGEYKDAKDQIANANESDKQNKYGKAVKALEDKDYQLAIDLLETLQGYKDADNLLYKARGHHVIKKYEDQGIDFEALNDVHISKLIEISEELQPFIQDEGVLLCYQKVSYVIGFKRLNLGNYDLAIGNFRDAGAYIHSEDKINEIVAYGLDKAMADGNKEAAISLYEQVLVPAGYNGDLYLFAPGYKGAEMRCVFDLFKPLEISVKVPDDGIEYKEEYVPYVKQLEEHFGMNADGVITQSEYDEINGTIYQGCKNDTVKNVLEKLADLGYISKLPESHSTYEAKYVSSVEKAEQVLGFVADGIITPNEYDAIMAQEVAKPEKVQNLKMSVKNDNVTLTWSKVPGAVYYEIQEGVVSLEGKYILPMAVGSTKQTRWDDKGVPTGAQREYIVIAHKYTVSSDQSRVGQYIDKFYCKVNLNQLNQSDDGYIWRYVELSRIPVAGFMVKGPNDADFHEIDNSQMILLDYMKASNNEDYDVRVICTQGNNAVCFVIKDYKSWNSKLLLNRNTVKSFSARGKVVETRPGNRKYGRFSIVEVDWFEWK